MLLTPFYRTDYSSSEETCPSKCRKSKIQSWAPNTNATSTTLLFPACTGLLYGLPENTHHVRESLHSRVILPHSIILLTCCSHCLSRREGKKDCLHQKHLLYFHRGPSDGSAHCLMNYWRRKKNKNTRPFRWSDPVSNDYFSPCEMLRHTSALIPGMCGDNLTFSLTCRLKDLHFIRETCIINLPY